ncbi:MAG: cell wall-binding repeat-containing protein [Solirubrobacteraceae bacterium]
MLRLRPSLLCSAVILPLLFLASCGGDKPKATTPPVTATTPTTQGSTTSSSTVTESPRSYTANTTRIDAADPAAVAASTALTMYPSTAKDLRPTAVAFAGADDWRSILLASSFAAKPLGFPLLLTENGKLPPVSANALALLQPKGSRAMNEAQGIRIGVSTRPGNFRTRYLTSVTPAGLAQQVDEQLTKARGRASSRILLVNSDDAASAAPAAAWAARSGDPILFTTSGSIPAETKAAIATHQNPRIYVLGGPETVSSFVIRSLQAIPGVSVFRITPSAAAGGSTEGGPADLAIAFAKYSDRDMGFNYNLPGHGFVFASTKDPTSAMAAAALSSGGQYPALLYVDRPDHLEANVKSYLLDEQPGYDSNHPATQGFYNHGWIIGPTTAIEASTQARIDSLLEIVQTDNPNALGDSPDTATQTEASP